MTYQKRNVPVAEIRRFMEPGPVVLVTSAWQGERNVMTMGWHMVMEFVPSLIGCIISPANHSYEMIRRSGECVINIPTVDIADIVVGIGNCSGKDTDKFSKFNLSARKGSRVTAPILHACYANLECRVKDTRLLNQYSMFILEVVKAQAAISPKNPKTIHYRGNGEFIIAGDTRSWKRKFKPEML